MTPNQATLVQFSAQSDEVQLQALAQAAIPRDESLPPADQDRELAAVLRRVMSDHGFVGRKVVTCLGAQHLFVQNLRLPALSPDEVERQIRMEIEERLPYAVTDAEIRHVAAGSVRQEAGLKQEMLLLACHGGLLRRHLALLEQAGLAPQAVDVEGLALLRALVPPDAVRTRQAYLLLGERTTAVVVADGRQLLFLKYLSTGIEHLDMAVARHLVQTPVAASQTRSLVSGSSTVDLSNDVHRAVLDATRPLMDALCTEIELCLRYVRVTFRGQPLDSLVLAGPSATPWLADLFSQRLTLKTGVGDPFFVAGPVPGKAREQAGAWSVACGLALRFWQRGESVATQPLTAGALA